jgi:copper chaperone CopZ
MKKVYRLEHLDCAHCAAKMENAIGKLDGVKKATVSFLTQKLTIEVEEEEKLSEVMEKAVSACKKIEPGCKIVL